MGCIHSKRDIESVPNIFHVTNIDDEGNERWSGELEITRSELILYRKGKPPTHWPLRSLRRYGCDSELSLFSFESGRRCITGEGIYAFKCRRAENLFHTLQAYIQGRQYSSDENTNLPPDNHFTTLPMTSNGPVVAPRHSLPQIMGNRDSVIQTTSNSGSYIINSGRGTMATSQSFSPNGTLQHQSFQQSRSIDTLASSNYLEPTPLRPPANQPLLPPHTRFSTGMRLGSVSSAPISPDLTTSPGSPNSINILEVTQLNPLPQPHEGHHHGVSNVYQEFPVRGGDFGANSSKKLSLDIPPQQQAPAVNTSSSVNTASTATSIAESICMPNYMNMPTSPSDGTDPASRMYMNVSPGEFQFTAQQLQTPTNTASQMFSFNRLNSTFSVDPNRCYENLEPGQVLRSRLSKPDIFANVELPPVDRSEPCTPTITLAVRTVNYIVLDLDKSSTAISISPTTSTSGQLGGAHSNSSIENNNPNLSSLNNNNNNNDLTSTNQNSGSGVLKGAITPSSSQLLPPESPHKASLGYATIDFNKTVALSNTTTPSQELDSEGSRKTRHNLTAVPPVALTTVPRHSNSLSD